MNALLPSLAHPCTETYFSFSQINLNLFVKDFVELFIVFPISFEEIQLGIREKYAGSRLL